MAAVPIHTALEVLRDDGFRLVVGELIAMAGVAALLLQLLRWRTADRSVLYFGWASLLYGLRLILDMGLLQTAFPRFPHHEVVSAITLVIPYPFILFLGDTIGRAYPSFTRSLLIAIAGIDVLGAIRLAERAPMDQVWFLNGIVTVASVIGWLLIGLLWRSSVDREARVIRIGLMVMGLTAIYQNLWVMGALPPARWVEPLGVVFMLATFLYVSATRSLRTETNLISLHNELEIARRIQAQLLPVIDGPIAGVTIQARYAPAGSVAGDFYDLLSEGTALGLLIADVSGHGVPAALSASMLKVALRAQQVHIASPAKVLDGLNQTLCKTLQDQFITAAYVYLDTARHELRYAGAGHPPLLLWIAAKGRVETLEENGMFLGPFSWAHYAERIVPFEPGDRCLLYTDGIVEATNRAEEEFGTARLQDFLARRAGDRPDAFCVALFDEIEAWSGGDPANQKDDITFVLAEFQTTG